MTSGGLHTVISSSSFLEWAFLRWVLDPATIAGIEGHVVPQQPVSVDGRQYRVDYELVGETIRIAVELDGFAYHSSRPAFTYDRFRQNDLAAAGRTVVRFTYDAIRVDTARCIAQLQVMLRLDPVLSHYVEPDPQVKQPEMDPDPLHALDPPPRTHTGGVEPDMAVAEPVSYFNDVRTRLNHPTLRLCQREAFAALANYYGAGGSNAACVMSVGAGKTALGVLAALAFTQRRALIVTRGR